MWFRSSVSGNVVVPTVPGNGCTPFVRSGRCASDSFSPSRSVVTGMKGFVTPLNVTSG